MLDPQTERRTIQRARKGDRDAIAELIRAYQRPLEAFLFRLCGQSDLAEDLAQESFVRVIRSLDRFDERFRFSTWLFTIGKRLLVNHQQKMRPLADSEVVEYRRVMRGPQPRKSRRPSARSVSRNLSPWHLTRS